MSLESDYKGTLVKLINVNNMTEIQGTLEKFDEKTNNVSLSKSIMVVNRAVADLASTFNDIIKYKYVGDKVGSTIPYPLGPIFNNVGEKSMVYFNMINYVFVPIYTNKIDPEVNIGYDDDLNKALGLKDAMFSYIDSVYEQYMEYSDYFLSEAKYEEDIQDDKVEKVEEEEVKNLN